MPTVSKPIDPVDLFFLCFAMVIVILDTLVIAYIMVAGVKPDPSMTPIFASFIASTAVGSISAWVAYRYGSSKGSDAKSDTVAAIATEKATN